MRRATGEKTVLLAARSAVALYRLLDVLPVFEGDARITRRFALVPGSDFGTDAFSAVGAAGARTLPWHEAVRRPYDLVLTASPKGELHLLQGRRVLLPHGAGFGKTIAGEGSADSASGLDPSYLGAPGGAGDGDSRSDGDSERDSSGDGNGGGGSRSDGDGGDGLVLYALAHPGQVEQLATTSPQAALRARVVGDPTLERLLVSRPLRDGYREAVGSAGKRLVVLASTWGPESLLARRPGLPAELRARLPYDEYQLALIVHPNEWGRLGEYELGQRLAPALDAGTVLAGPYEEWAALLVAADVLVTDHGSAALYFAAFDDRPVLNAYDGGSELLAGSPIDELLATAPALGRGTDLREALAGYRPGAGRAAAARAFARQGSVLDGLRHELYGLLGLAPPTTPAAPRPLPRPAAATRTPAAFDVHARTDERAVHVARSPAGLGPAGHHLAVEHGPAGEFAARTAGLLYRRPQPATGTAPYARWTAGGWIAHALEEYPACRTAAAIPSEGLCLLRTRGGGPGAGLWSVRVEPAEHAGRVVTADPAVALSAVHAWLAAHGPHPPARLDCVTGEHTFHLRVAPATGPEARLTL